MDKQTSSPETDGEMVLNEMDEEDVNDKIEISASCESPRGHQSTAM
eukprot:CAMPEP_0201593476 /NCGR_PEP_ID=MMETSP0190_2-20130828/191066_1 /ASSEMBLY_ACC=CAM_ASM_000263 /TAXON_ID=37353 /ORGANISM="Rosalina sp." /LENGTH=45 /DNA_ID= /DNA_START= /DNA_END= /DNA_ORIENTATION=